MQYQTSGVGLKSVRRNYVRKTSQTDRYVGTFFMVVTAGVIFLALLRMLIHA